MAINNWRYVVTWGYMDPNWNIVEEKQWVPAPLTTGTTQSSYTANMFPRAEAYWLQAQGYANLGNDAMAKVYWDIANDLGKYSTFANTSVNTADALLNYLQQNEANLQWAAWTLYNQLTDDIQNQRNYIMNMFGPEGTLTQEVNKYYDDLGNYLASDAWYQAAKIAAQWVHSWASLGSIRAQENEAYNQSFQRYIQAKEQEINAKQSIAANLINYMSTLRKEYGDTTNQYIIELYKRAYDMYNSVAQSIASDLDQYNALRFKWTWTWSSWYNALDLLNPTSNSQANSNWNQTVTTPAWKTNNTTSSSWSSWAPSWSDVANAYLGMRTIVSPFMAGITIPLMRKINNNQNK